MFCSGQFNTLLISSEMKPKAFWHHSEPLHLPPPGPKCSQKHGERALLDVLPGDKQGTVSCRVDKTTWSALSGAHIQQVPLLLFSSLPLKHPESASVCSPAKQLVFYLRAAKNKTALSDNTKPHLLREFNHCVLSVRSVLRGEGARREASAFSLMSD